MTQAFTDAASYIINQFKGIRQIDGLNGLNGQISAITAINVEAQPIEDGSGYYLKTTLGNTKIAQLEGGYRIIKDFETEQDGTKYFIAYAENEEQGALYKYDDTGFTLILNGLEVTGQANGITMNDTAYDVFVFTNGKNFESICFAKTPVTETINPLYDSEVIEGLTIAEQAGSLVIGGNNGVVSASRKGDIFDWDYVKPADDLTKPWYQIVGKQITAVVPYINGLMVFTRDDSRMFLGNMSNYEDAEVQSASLGGCFSYESWCIHDKYLFFYDDNQKNIYYYLQSDIGQKVLGEPVGNNIQTFFHRPQKVSLMSFIGDNKSEIWLKIDDVTLIYNYFQGEFYQRKQNPVNSYCVYDYEIYSCDDNGNLFKERAKNSENCIFDGVYIPAVYETPYMDFGNCNYLKELDENPLLTYGKNFNNNFKITFDNIKKKKHKRIDLDQGADFIWADDDSPEEGVYLWDVAIFPADFSYIKGTKKAKAPNAFYFLKFILETEKEGDDFAISQVELRIDSVEKDTLGLK